MFTVVIAQQSYLDDLKRFSPYMAPYLKNRNVVYCCWNPEAKTLNEAVPELDRTISMVKDWRAVIICGTESQSELMHQRNPFCACAYTAPTQEIGEELQDYYAKVLEAKTQAYHKAAEQPLTKLATWLNNDPTISEELIQAEEIEHIREDNNDADEIGKVTHWEETLQLNEYYAEAAVKAETRKQIRSGSQLRSAYPKEIVCIALRNFTEQSNEIATAWDMDICRSYSNFCDWNLYYDTMRFLVFDIMSSIKNNYELDILRFLSTVACFSANPTPKEAIKPGILYRIVSEANEDALKKSINDYDAKMRVTKDLLKDRIQKIKEKERGHLTDKQAKGLFCLNEPVAVTIPTEASKDDLYVSKNMLGLSENSPQDENNWWQTAYSVSKKAVLDYLKQPRRGINRAANSVHGRENPELSAAADLNEFQFEDVIEHTQDEELKMIRTKVCDLYDVERFEEKLTAADKEVRTEIHKRMKKTTTIGIVIAVLACCFICYLPMLFSNAATPETVLCTLIMMAGSLCLTAIIMLIVLVCMRKILLDKVGDYNDTVSEIETELNESMVAYSSYLSHVCNVLRGNSVINYRAGSGDPDQKEIIILKKHINDIEESRTALAGTFRHYLNERAHTDITAEDAYPFDFSQPEEYEYLISFSDDQETKIEFFDDDLYVDVPVNFLLRISAEREELYD